MLLLHQRDHLRYTQHCTLGTWWISTEKCASDGEKHWLQHPGPNRRKVLRPLCPMLEFPCKNQALPSTHDESKTVDQPKVWDSPRKHSKSLCSQTTTDCLESGISVADNTCKMLSEIMVRQKLWKDITYKVSVKWATVNQKINRCNYQHLWIIIFAQSKQMCRFKHEMFVNNHNQRITKPQEQEVGETFHRTA